MIEVQHHTQRKALLYPAAQVYDWGTTLVIALYPDHQWLGCGGAIALLRQMGYRVRILFMGNSPIAYPSEAAVRRQSAQTMARLGVCDEASAYFSLRNGLFPHRGHAGFEEAVRLVTNELEDLQPDTIVLPMTSSDQLDLLATEQIVREAQRQLPVPLRTIEYPLLNSTSLTYQVTKPTLEYEVWRLDIKEVMDRKAQALQPFQNYSDAPAPDIIPSWEAYLEYSG